MINGKLIFLKSTTTTTFIDTIVITYSIAKGTWNKKKELLSKPPPHWDPLITDTVEPRYNDGPRDWQIVFALTRFRYIEVLFHIFH